MSALELIDRLAKQGFVTAKVAERLRQQIKESPKEITAAALAKLLVKKGQLTSAQAQYILEPPSVPPPSAPQTPSPPPRLPDDELGLAPDESPPIVEPVVDDIVEDAEEPLRPPRRAGRVPVVEPIEESPGWDPESGPSDELSAADDHFDELAGQTGGQAIPARRRGLAGVLAALRPGGRRKVSVNRWDSPLMLLGGGSLLVLTLVGVALYLYLSRGTGDEAFTAANESYRQQAYGQATSTFQKFIAGYPDHPRVSLAKVRIGLAQIWSEVERKRWTEALAAVRSTLPQLENEEAFAEARPELASLLPEIMEGFADDALAAADVRTAEQLLVSATDTLSEVNNPSYLPTSERKGQQPRIDEVLAKLESVKRRINQDRELEKTIAAIQAAAGEGDIAAAYQLRKQLLSIYPNLEVDASLSAAVLAVTEIERQAVQPLSDPPQPLTDDPPVASQFRVTLSNRRGQTASGLNDQTVFVLARGSVYGVNAADGTVRWRQFVGHESTIEPLDLTLLGANDVLVVESQRNELQRRAGATGQLIWRLPCPGRLAAPRLEAGRILVAGHDAQHGYVMSVDPQDGRVVGGATLPVPLTVSPALDLDGQRLIQPATHSSIYLLSLADWSCQGVTYLGHAASTVVVPPVVVSGAVLVAENPGVDFSLLHVLVADSDKPGTLKRVVEPRRLTGQTVVPLHAFGRRVLLTTDRGLALVLEIDLNQTAAPVRVAVESITSVAQSTVSYPLLEEGRLWVSDNQLVGYELQTSRGQLVQKWISHKGDAFVAPLQYHQGTLFHLRQPAGKAGLTLAATAVGGQADVREGEPIWEVDLAVPAAGVPFVNRAAQEIDVVTANGALYAIDKDKIRQGLDATPAELNTDAMPTILNRDVVFTPTRRAFLPSALGERILFHDSALAQRQLQWINLELGGQRVGGAAVAFREQLLLPLLSGSVALFDPATGKATAAPFLPPTAVDVEVKWWRPFVTAEGEILTADMRGNLYRLTWNETPQPNLTLVRHQQLDAPLVADPVVVGETVVGIVRGAQQDVLRRLRWGDLQLQDQVELPGRVVWGPFSLGKLGLLMTDRGQLIGLDADQVRFTIDTLDGPAVGEPQLYEQGFVLATVAGSLWYLDATQGTILAQVNVAETLGTGPAQFAGNRFIVCGGDGTVHILPVAVKQ